MYEVNQISSLGANVVLWRGKYHVRVVEICSGHIEAIYG